MKRIGFLLVLVTLLAAACSSDNKSTTSSSGPTTAKVQVDGSTPAFNAAFTSYFPNEVKVHPGDTVSFNSVFRGEPHSVSFGTLVDQGLAAAAPHANDQNFDESSIPQLAAIPPMVPQGPGDANQVSAQPCFITSGNPPGPGDTPCPNHSATPPEFTGTESFFSSGFLPNGDTFNVKLASNIKPGTYSYFCTLHTTSMVGKVTVVAADTKVPTATENQAAADQQLQSKVQALQPAVDAAKNSTPDKAAAGVASEQVQDAEANIFAPQTASIPVGGTVNWTILGAHTISFNAPEDAKVIIAKAPDGSVHLNQKTGAPAGGGVPQPQSPPGGDQSGGSSSTTTAASSTTTTGAESTTTGAGGGGPGGLPPATPVDGGSYNGSGFYSSGFYLSFPPNFNSYTMKFTKAGTYNYVCLVHPGMEGTVKVG
ncbi:MAG: hypothetical protein M3159_05910 [Actinomycetota bacterium]|nr:hypothetical protein [Actinomycetota bacterium]